MSSDLVTKKSLVNGQGVRGPVGQRGTPIKFGFKVTGPAGYEETFELEAGGEPKELKGLYFGEYKVEETNAQDYTASVRKNPKSNTKQIAKVTLIAILS